MPRDRDRGDSISPSTGQSKRPSNQQDSESLDNDQTQLGQAQHNQQQQQQRTHHKAQRHHVAAGGRLYGRVPSSKGLHKHNTSTSSAKLTRRVTSPSPERSTAGFASSGHRRHPSSSDVKLSRDPSSTTLKNSSTSQASLKRNKSHIEVAKRSKPSGQLKRSSSEKAVNKLKSSKSAVHFDLGNDGQQEDEWVDASSSASPYLSRRGSVNTSGQSSANAQGTYYGSPAADGDGDDEPTPLAEPQRLLFDDNREHSRNLTSRLLQRTPSHSATTSTSNMTALARATSPDRRHSNSTLSVTPAQLQSMAGSNGQEGVTSRFVTQASAGSYFTTGGAGQLGMEPKAPHSPDNPPGLTVNGLSGTTEYPDDDELTDEDETGVTTSAIATTARSRKVGAVQAAPPEKSRTQQKINLQRASSSMEPVRHRHSGIGGFAAEVAEVAGPLLGGAGYESQDPRVNKLLERTGVEYNIVRRYQNPVGRSLVRLAQLPGNDKARRIPQPGTPGGPGNRQSVQSIGAGQFGLSQSFKDVRESGSGAKRPGIPKRAYSSVRPGGLSSSVDTDDGAAVARMHEGSGQRLSGASLVNGEDDDGTQAILRAMWDKNLDLGESHD